MTTASGPKAVPPCPICGKPVNLASRPFCSGRCADIDLNRWLSGTYAVPVAPDEEDGRSGGGEEERER